MNSEAYGVLYSTNIPVTTGTYFNTIGVGPQNLANYSVGVAGQIQDPNVDSVNITVSPGLYSSSYNPIFTYILKDGVYNTKCGDAQVKFAFINKFGVWDYYNVFNPVIKQTEVSRSTYTRPFVRYEDSTAFYNISNKGQVQYLTEYTDVYEVTTDFLSQVTSDWLTELFDSPNVYINRNGEFIPVNILNTNVRWNMNQNRQKLFQYTIQYKLANDRFSR